MASIYLNGPLAESVGCCGVALDVGGTTTVGQLKAEVAGLAKVACDDFDMMHEGRVLADMGVQASQMALCGGDEVVLQPSKRFEAGRRLRGMGLSPDYEGYSQVMESEPEDGRVGVVQLMIDSSPDFLNVRNEKGITPVIRAARCGFADVVQVLIDNGADVRLAAHSGTALHFAALDGHSDVTKILLDNGAEPGRGGLKGAKPLHISCERGCLAVAEQLLAYGADIHAEDDNKQTAMHVAALEGHMDIVQALVSKGADVLATTASGATAMHMAANYGHADIVAYLHSRGCDVNAHDKLGSKPLHLAAEDGSVDTISYLLEHGTDIDSRDARGFQALHIAAGRHHVAASRYLTTKGADVNSKNNAGGTPLHFAASVGCLTMTQHLISLGASIEVEDDDGYTALHVAAAEGRDGVAALLVEKGCNPTYASTRDGSDNPKGSTPLHTASRLGYLHVVQRLISLGAKVDCSSVKGATPLRLAVCAGYVETAVYLLGRGAQVDEVDSEGNTLMHSAGETGAAMVRMLAAKGLSVKVNNHAGKTPLHAAVHSGEVVEALLELGADAGCEDGSGMVALLTAALGGHVGAVRALTQRGPSYIHDADNAKNTALHLAAKEGHLDVVSELIEAGADVNTQNHMGHTPSSLAAKMGFTGIVDFLATKGGDVNLPAGDGTTSLHHAAQEGHTATIRCLISHAAHINKGDVRGATPLHMAVANKHVEVVRVLVRAGAAVGVVDNTGSTPADLLDGREEEMEKIFFPTGAVRRLEM